MVNVAGVDSHFMWVKQRRAHIFSPPENHPFGERQYTVEDPGGHRGLFLNRWRMLHPRIGVVNRPISKRLGCHPARRRVVLAGKGGSISAMNIVNIGYDSTNYYLLEPDPVKPSGQASSGLLIDVGWPGTLPKLLSICKRKGVVFQKIKYLLITHYHPDHAGLAQEMKNQGVQLIVIENQLAYIPTLGRFMKAGNHYLEINLDDNIILKASESRNYLKSIGINGEILETPGHSEDSVSLILDEGSAFTGDLRPPMAVTKAARSQAEKSWAKIRSFHVKTIYPGHGPAQQIE